MDSPTIPPDMVLRESTANNPQNSTMKAPRTSSQTLNHLHVNKCKIQ